MRRAARGVRRPARLVAAIVGAGALAAGLLVSSPASGTASGTAEPGNTAEPTNMAEPSNDDPTFTFLAGLPRDTSALQAAARQRSTPGAPLYRNFLTLRQAAARYGASKADVAALRTAAAAQGVSVSIDRTRMLARLTAPRSTWERLYGTSMVTVEPSAALPYRQLVLEDEEGFAGAPPAFADVTSGWVAQAAVYVPDADLPGIDDTEAQGFADLLAFPGTPVEFPRNEGTPLGDTCDQPALENRAVYNINQVRDAYGSSTLAERGMTGKGTRLTIVSLGYGFNPPDISLAAECFGHRQPRIAIQRGTGVPEAFRNAGPETHLDLIAASAVVPDAASIRLLQVVGPAPGVTDSLALSLDYDGKGLVSPDVVSVSYGTCEATYASQRAQIIPVNEDLLALAAVVGTSVLYAAGDFGTSMCGAEASEATDRPLAWYPASSPWVTAVGGTRLYLGDDNQRTLEVVWNDLRYTQSPGASPPAAGGAGGPSEVFARPWYQAGATVAGPRALPDVALLGALKPGWPIFYGGTLYTVGGTSGGAPFLAANLALIAAAERKAGRPGIGFANPWLYRIGASTRPPFYDVREGNNAVMGLPCCTAEKGFDMASGLGAPRIDRLPGLVPRPGR